MKSRILTTAALFCTALFVRADVEVTMAQLRNIGFLPQDKADLKPEDKLDLKRRNPFAERKKANASKPTETAETEESKLRAYFEKLKISGFSDIGGKLIVTMGRHNLEAGQVLPQVIPGQTQILRVMRVEKNLLEIGWVEETAGYEIATPRKITKKIDLKPYVQVLLASEDNTGENAQMYIMDGEGKIVMPPRTNMLPNPSEIADNLPPGSDTNPDSALSVAEQDDLNAVDAAQNPPPPPTPAPDAVPNAVPSGEVPAPAESSEDRVQPEPDMVPPPADDESKPAGPPAQ